MNPDTLLKQANILGKEASGQTGLAFAPINSSTLSSSAPVAIPTPTPTPNPAAPIIASSQAYDAQAQKQAEANVNANNAGVTALQNERTGTLSKISDLVSKITGAQTTAAQPNVAVDTANKELANLNTQIADVNVAYRGETDANKARGDITKEGQQALQFNTDAKYGRQLADLAIRQSAANQNVTALTTAAERKLALTLAPLQTELNYYKDFVLNNIDSLTKDEKDKANAIITEKQRLIDQHIAEQKTGTDAIKTALDNGVKLPDAVVAQITANPKNAYQILAQNGISLQSPLDVQTKRAQLALTYANIAKLNADNAVLSIKDAQALGVPYGTTKSQAIALGKVPGVSSAASELKVNALSSAKALLDKIATGTGTSAVGTSRIFGLQLIPGTNAKDFQVQLDNLKSLLSLDNVKLLKGQGQVSDAERLLLERASGKLDPGQSEDSFKKALQDIQKALTGTSGSAGSSGTYIPGTVVEYQGKQYKVGADGDTLESI